MSRVSQYGISAVPVWYQCAKHNRRWPFNAAEAPQEKLIGTSTNKSWDFSEYN